MEKVERCKMVVKINKYPCADCANRTKRKWATMLLLTNPYTGRYHEITGTLLQLLILFTDSSTTT